MARTTRRRDPSELVNVNRGMKKNDRRSSRKDSKRRLQEMDYTNVKAANLEDDENYTRGYN